jgi:hypothetical protein
MSSNKKKGLIFLVVTAILLPIDIMMFSAGSGSIIFSVITGACAGYALKYFFQKEEQK